MTPSLVGHDRLTATNLEEPGMLVSAAAILKVSIQALGKLQDQKASRASECVKCGEENGQWKNQVSDLQGYVN